MRRTRTVDSLAAAILTSILLSSSFAATSARGEDGALSNEPAADAAKGKDQKLHLNEVEIQGELEKPKIFFILPKAKREAQAKQKQFRFYPDILEPLDKDRFEEEAHVLYQNGIPAE
jgi:hypothetical protein